MVFRCYKGHTLKYFQNLSYRYMALWNRQVAPPQLEPPAGPAPTDTGGPPGTSVLACRDHSSDANSTTLGGDSRNQIRDPDIAPLPRTFPNDIRYFFVFSGVRLICDVCRQVFIRS